MPNTKDIKAEIVKIIRKNGEIQVSASGKVHSITLHSGDEDQAAQAILDKIGERIPKKYEHYFYDSVRGYEYKSGRNDCIDELRQALGLAKGG